MRILTHRKYLSIAACLAAAGVLRAPAQYWETISILSLDSRPNALLVDPFSSPDSPPGLFMGGGPVYHLEQSAVPPTLAVSDAAPGTSSAFAVGPTGQLYVARWVNTSWQVRRSIDTGVTWTTIDDATTWNAKDTTKAYGVAVDGLGNVYASGTIEKGNGNLWVIRRGANNGTSWKTVYTASKQNSNGRGVVVVPAIPQKHAGGIFAVGGLTPGSSTQWTVLRSRDTGNSWSVVDSWSPGKNQGAFAFAITATINGDIFVAGQGGVAPSSGWWVRKSTDGGTTWQTILANYSSGATSLSEQPEEITADPFGNVYVTGLFLNSSGKATATVRRWDAATSSWDNWPDSLRHPLQDTQEISRSGSITTDSFGTVYLGSTASGYTGWIIQRLRP